MPKWTYGHRGPNGGSGSLLLIGSVLLCCAVGAVQSAVASGTAVEANSVRAKDLQTCKEYLASNKQYSKSLELYLLLQAEIHLLGFHIVLAAKVVGLQRAYDHCGTDIAKLTLLAKHCVIPHSTAKNLDDMKEQSDKHELKSYAGREHTCHKYDNGLFVISGGIVLNIELCKDGIVIEVSFIGPLHADNLDGGLALVGLRLNLGSLLAIVLKALNALLFGNGPHHCDGCTILLPSSENLKLLDIEISLLAGLGSKKESPLNYVLAEKYYPADLILLEFVINLLGIQLKISVRLGGIIDIGGYLIDTDTYTECDKSIIYTRPANDKLAKIGNSQA